MAFLSRSPDFADLAVALPAYIRQPMLKQLAERMQGELLSNAVMPLLQNERHLTDNYCAQSSLILNELYQTPLADASVLVAITHEPRPKLLLTRRAVHLNSHLLRRR